MQNCLVIRKGDNKSFHADRFAAYELRVNLDQTRSLMRQQENHSPWQDYRRRRRIFFVIWVTYVPGVFILSYPLSKMFDSGMPVYAIAGAWMLAFVISSIYLSSFPCPRCHRSFFYTWWFHNPFARRCVHCGLPKWSDQHAVK
jgi:hypothetical protein